MSSFWYAKDNTFALQEWQPGVRVKELSTNIRSGNDKWWNQVLEECRNGNLSEQNFCWLHGLPTMAIRKSDVPFWYEHRETTMCPCTCKEEDADDTCAACLTEKHRRCRWFQRRTDMKLETDGFQEAMFLTPYHNAVWKYVQACTLNWAKARGVQITWLQTKDIISHGFGQYFADEGALNAEQSKWRHFNARKRQGILGLLGLCLGMRYRISDGNLANCRQYGIRTSATCVMRGIHLCDEDEETVKASKASELTL